jgi:parallel beta-helix repeat protein
MKNKWNKRDLPLFIIVVCLFFCCSGCGKDYNEETDNNASGENTIYYVSVNGNDNNSGLNMEEPFRTLKYALSVVKPGQIIELLAGIYHEQVMVENIINQKNDIIIQGNQESLVVFDGNQTLDYGIFLSECTHFVIKNLEFRNYKSAGINIELCSYITIQDISLLHNGYESSHPDWEGEGFGLNVDTCDNLLIEGVEATLNGPGPERRSQGILGTGINTYMLSDAIIRNNTANENIGGGFLIEDSVRVVVENNIAKFNDSLATCPNPEDNWWDAGLWLDGGHTITIKNNYFNQNLGPGLQISNEDHQNPYGYIVENNEIKQNQYGILIWNFGQCPFPNENILKISGNIISDNKTLDIWCTEGDY